MPDADYLVGVEEYELAFVEDVLDQSPTDSQTVYKETIDIPERAIAAVAAKRAGAGGGGGSSDAADVSITDSGTYYTGTDVEAALQEVGLALSGTQPLDSDLTAIAALSTTTFGRSLLALADAAAARTALSLVPGTDVQAHDADLDTYASITPSANVQSLLGAANYAAMRTLLSLVVGTDVEAHDADLTTIAGLSATNDDILQRKSGAWANRTMAQLISDLAALGTTFQPLDSDLTAFAGLSIAADKLPYGTGSHTLGLADLTSFARTILDDADAATARTTLGAAASLVTLNTQTASYTLVLGDAGCVVEINNASANTLTVPPNSSVAFSVGTIIEVHQYGAGQTTLTPGSGVTIRSAGSKLKLTAQYSSAALRKRATDEWVAVGDLSS